MNPRYPFIQPSSGALVSNGQAYQDIFVLSLFNGKSNGTYLEIGAHWPQSINNTYLLSSGYNWRGVSLENDKQYKHKWEEIRPNDGYVEDDALTLDYGKLLKEHFGELKNIDYLQCDIDPCTNTFAALKNIPHNEYRFGVITFETDFYVGGDAIQVRDESREFLLNLGYTLIIPDVLVNYHGTLVPYEDWYVDMNLVNPDVAKMIQYQSVLTRNPSDLLFI